MSDFDAVLERLLTDPSFPAHLAADPTGALAGYDLAADEVALLLQQVGTDTGAPSATVEDRVTKSSTFGLLSALGDAFGGAGRSGFGSAPAAGGGGGGDVTARSGLGPAPHAAPAGSAAGAWLAGGDPGARSGFGAAPHGGGESAVSGIGDAPRSGLGAAGDAAGGHAQTEHLAAPKGYHNRVDADGDGRLDEATYRGRAGGGAEIRVDLDGDGRADFVGVDRDLDNRVDFADYDKDHDGVFEKRMHDDDGDGFLDRSVIR